MVWTRQDEPNLLFCGWWWQLWCETHLSLLHHWPVKKKLIKSVRSELLSRELLRKSSLTFSSLSPTCSLFEVSAIPPGVMDLTNIPLSPPITEKPRPPEGGFSRSTVTISSWIIKWINFLQWKITIKKMHVCVYSPLLTQQWVTSRGHSAARLSVFNWSSPLRNPDTQSKIGIKETMNK